MYYSTSFNVFILQQLWLFQKCFMNKYDLTMGARLFVSVCKGTEEPSVAHLQAGQGQGVPAPQQRLLPHKLSCERDGGLLPQNHHLTGKCLWCAAGQQEEHAGEGKTQQCWAGWVTHPTHTGDILHIYL